AGGPWWSARLLLPLPVAVVRATRGRVRVDRRRLRAGAPDALPPIPGVVGWRLARALFLGGREDALALHSHSVAASPAGWACAQLDLAGMRAPRPAIPGDAHTGWTACARGR